LRVGAQRTHMNQPCHTRLAHGGGDALGQLHMHLLKALFAAMQNGDQVDDRTVSGDQLCERGFIERAGFRHGQARQGLHAGRVAGSACGHRHTVTGAHQLFTHMATDETAAAENEDMRGLHVLHSGADHCTAWQAILMPLKSRRAGRSCLQMSVACGQRG